MLQEDGREGLSGILYDRQWKTVMIRLLRNTGRGREQQQIYSSVCV